ncbi:hypothetical protein [Nonomuraea candida]|nr:hypothetical protein [Nonomuraea candida]
MTDDTRTGLLAGKVAFVTGASRGIGAATYGPEGIRDGGLR